MTINRNIPYRLRTDVAIEDFDECSLIFQAADSTLTEINRITRDILLHMDGTRTVHDIAAIIAANCEETADCVIDDILHIMTHLESLRIIKPVYRDLAAKGKTHMNETDPVYLANPDVSCRIEDDDGAILYCADTAATQIINPIGLEIWETLSSPHTTDELVKHLMTVCEGAPEDGIRNDVDEFVSKLGRGGFIGAVENSDND